MIGCCSQEMDTLTQERHSSTVILSSGPGCLRASLSFSGEDRKRKEIKAFLSNHTEVILRKAGCFGKQTQMNKKNV